MLRDVNIGNVKLDSRMPKICVPVSGSSKEEVTWEIEQIHKIPCDMIEWRVDYFREDIVSSIGGVKAAAGDTPVLITYRSKSEGGKGKYDDKGYASLLKEIIASRGVDAVDIEFMRPCCRELVELAAAQKIATVVSYHNFNETDPPEFLEEQLMKMEETGADVPKISVMPKDFSDVISLLDVSMRVSKVNAPIIAVSMGKLGKISRICGEMVGSAVTFASCKTGSAPGQIRAEKLKEFLAEINAGK